LISCLQKVSDWLCVRPELCMHRQRLRNDLNDLRTLLGDAMICAGNTTKVTVGSKHYSIRRLSPPKSYIWLQTIAGCLKMR
jgi:hypothetical protein